ncbi:MAG: NADH-quinone oxidoreductase subunit L [Candidatus Micrarchaeota archaeon]|nr:MAG: NADH-quinone oxidoreductase subunit L [Candidatus Micrarchaeota archaeon]
MIPYLLFIPLIVGMLIYLVLPNDKDSLSKIVAIIASLLTLILNILLYADLNSIYTISWFSISSYSFNIELTFNYINYLLSIIVSFIGFLINIYAAGYIDSSSRRFFFELSLFELGMLIFALSYSILALLIGWELLGISSYLLIGFYYERKDAAFSSRKAITTVMLGDIFLLVGVALIFSQGFSSLYGITAADNTAILYGLIFILIGAFTKSAQFPFHEWLSDAMSGPTPVSAYLHSSTMVKAGVFLILLMLPEYQLYNLTDPILIIGFISALIGAINALSERHIKKVLAYSTIEDLGLMFIAIGLNLPYVALALFVFQTFYKAALFMYSGVVIKANDDREDIYKVSVDKGLIASISSLIAVLSLIGIFPLSGYFGKGFLLDSSIRSMSIGEYSYIAFALLVIIELLTSLYIFRWWLIPRRSKSNRSKVSNLMNAPFYILVIINALAYPIFLLFLYYITANGYSATYSIISIYTIIDYIIAGLAAYLSYKIVKSGYDKHIISFKSIVNSFYAALYNALNAFSLALSVFDSYIYRFYLYISNLFIILSSKVPIIQNGRLNTYIVIFIIGIIMVIAVLVI